MEENSKLENIVILAAILTGFIGSIFIYFLKLPPVFISVFLGTGVASLVYRFLGGTRDASMAMGTLKLSGSIAVLLGCAYYVNGQLVNQIKKIDEPVKEIIDFTPSTNDWFAIDKNSSLPIKVNISGDNDNVELPPSGIFKNVPLRIVLRNNKMYVVPENDSTYMLGRLEYDDFSEIGLFHSIEKSDKFIVTSRLAPNQTGIDLDPLPFKLSTERYGEDYSRYTLNNRTTGEAIYKGSIYRKRFEIIEVDAISYLIGVVEVNHESADPEAMYAKFAIARINKKRTK